MSLISTIIIIFIIMAIWGIVLANNHHKEELAKYKEEGLEYIDYYSLKCLSGFLDLGLYSSISMKLFKDRARITLFKENSAGSILDTKKLEIFSKDIIGVELQTEHQIKEQVSLGKLFVFGILAFGMNKKEKEVVREYIVLKFLHEEQEVSLVLSIKAYTSDAPSTVEKRQYELFTKLRQLKSGELVSKIQ